MINQPSGAPENDETLARLKRALAALEKMKARLDVVEQAATEPIAVIGMSCRFPGGANDPESFWRLLCDGVDAVREVPPDRWDIDTYYDADPSTPGKMYTRWGGFLEGWPVDSFDARFFGVAPREAEGIDPQHRLLLEVAHEALERAGQATSRLAGSLTGVFVGIMNADYAALHLKTGDPKRMDAYYALGNEPSFSAGRLSYLLGLRGPSMALNTACSSSLVALDLACQSLRAGRCNLAIAGGVNLMLSPEVTIASSRIRSQSPRGRCRTFDAGADGYVRAEGCGIVVLKRLADALADGDPILACYRGSATNHDGPSGGLTVPSGPAQEMLLRAALANARANPEDILYVEAHGTGTPLGDPIEVRALGAVLGQGREAKAPLAVGSVKTNLGHLEAAAGAAGLIKAILILQHGQIPPHIGLERLTPHVPWDELRVVVPTHLTPLPAAARPLVGVSAFGLSGINAHVVLEAAPATARVHAETRPDDVPILLPISARSPEALRDLARAYRAFLATGGPGATLPLHDVGYTAGVRRVHHEHRLSIVARTHEEVNARLDSFARGEASQGLTSGKVRPGLPRKLAFIFSGQGSQWVGMGRSLLETEPVFREAIEQCDRALVGQGGQSVIKALATGEDHAGVDRVEIVQPTLFAMQVALAALWRSWGVEPDAVVGHSMGEVAAAHVAGALSLEDAARIITERSRLLAGLSGRGAMAMVDLSVEQAREIIAGREERLAVAAVNGPRSTVLSGDPAEIAAVLAELERRGVFCRNVSVTVASHSPQVDPLCPELVRALQGIHPRPSLLPFISTVTGEMIDGASLDAGYWAWNLREPVLFSKAIDVLGERGHDLFVEVSPHPVLLPAIERGVGISSLRRGVDDRSALLESLGALYAEGHPTAFERLYPTGSRCAILPTYPWQRERFWSVGAPAPADELSRPLPSGDRSPGADGTPAQFYDALARSRGAVVDEEYLTFGLLPRSAPGFSWILAAFGLDASAEQTRMLQDGQRSLRNALLDSVDLSRVERALDFGCGYGSDLLTLAERNPHLRLHGYTISPEQAEIGARRLEARGHGGRAQIYHRDSSKDAFPDRYDLIFGFEVATHVRDKQALFANIEGHLRASGYLLLADFIADTDSGIEVVDTASYNVDEEGWLDLFCTHHLRIVECVDISAEVARFLDDPSFERNLSRVEAEIGLSPIERRNFEAMANFGRALERRLLRYVLFVIQKDDLARPAYLRHLNQRWLQAPTPYAERRAEGVPGDPSDEWLYRIDWERAPRVPSLAAARQAPALVGSTVLIFADPHGVAARLAALLIEGGAHAVLVDPGEGYRRNGERYVVRPGSAEDMARLFEDVQPPGAPPLRGAVHLWSLGVPAFEGVTPAELRVAEGLGCVSALQIVKALGRAVPCDQARLWIVTRGAQPVEAGAALGGVLSAPLWGFGRTLAVETPSMWGGLVDLDPRDPPGAAAALLLAELRGADGEDQVAYRRGERRVARLVKHPPFEPRPVPLREDGTYMITGGLGDLGLALADWMITRGARQLVLVSRSERRQSAVKALEDRGVRVLVATADVADQPAMEALFSRLREEGWPPLRGVIHAAGVVHQGPLLELSDSALDADFRPKVAGSIVLDRLLAGAPLDFFVFFSSGSALLGSPLLGGYAAANAFEDALAHARRARGLPALSINWGFWAERGMAAREGSIVPRGMDELSLEQGIAALERLLGQDSPQVGVMRIDLEAFRRFHPEYARLALMTGLIRSDDRPPRNAPRDAPGGPSVRAALAAVGPGFRRRSMMEEYLKEQLGQVLKIRPAEIDTQTPLRSFGLDSLMAIELRNRLEAGLGLKLSATIAFVHPTVTALGVHLGGELGLPLEPAEPSLDRRGSAGEASASPLDTLSEDELAAKLTETLASMQEEDR